LHYRLSDKLILCCASEIYMNVKIHCTTFTKNSLVHIELAYYIKYRSHTELQLSLETFFNVMKYLIKYIQWQ